MRQTSFRRRALALAGITAAAALTLTACSGGSGDSDGSDGSASGDVVKIGISQFAPHPALDAATAGFKDAIAEAGIDAEYDEQNAGGEQPTAVTIAEGFATANLDLVLAVATPSAQAAVNAISDVPILFTAVTDPVEAALVDSNEEPGANVTGTTDAVPADALQGQFDLIVELVPDAKQVGIVYSSGEVNSEVQVKNATEVAEAMGLEVVVKSVAAAGDIPGATEALGDVDAIYVPTDNLVVSNVASLIKVAEQKEIPVIAAEAGTVESGAIATQGIDYYALGYQTGEMAVRILEEGADPATMAVEETAARANTVNPGAAERMGVELPDKIIEGADIVE